MSKQLKKSLTFYRKGKYFKEKEKWAKILMITEIQEPLSRPSYIQSSSRKENWEKREMSLQNKSDDRHDNCQKLYGCSKRDILFVVTALNNHLTYQDINAT